MVRRGIVLVVDEDPPIAEFMAEALADAGYCVRLATDATSAITMIVDDPPDLALIDLRFGPMTGLDVVRAVRACGGTTPIVITTANTNDAHAIEAQGLVACLSKPFDLDDLFVCVAQHMASPSAGASSVA